MEWIAFIVACLLWSKISNLESKIKKCEKLLVTAQKASKKKKGVVDMSKILSELVGKRCKLKVRDVWEDYDKYECDILAVDEEWIKFTYVNNKKEVKTRIVRIEAVDHVDVLGE